MRPFNGGQSRRECSTPLAFTFATLRYPMLQSIRSTAGTWIVKILFVILIISFGVWGIGDMVRQASTPNHVAEVGDIVITPQQFDQEFRAEMNRLRQMLGPDFTDEQARQLGLMDRVLEQMIQRTLVTLAARDYGIRVGDELAAAEVREQPVFRNDLGQFDPNLMRLILRQNGMTEQGLLEQVRADLARSQLVGAVGTGAAVPKFLAESLYRHRAERRVADVVSVPNAAMPSPAAPDEETLARYHEAHAARYTAPETRDLVLAVLTPDSIGGDIGITDEELHDAYEARKSEFVVPERRHIVQAVLPDRAAAEKVAAVIAEGRSLEDAAKENGVEAVDLGASAREDLPEELAEPAFALAQGAVSPPIESPLGWHVLTVREITAGGGESFEQVRERLRADLRNEKAIDRLFEAANKMDDLMAGGASLEEAAQEAGAGALSSLDDIDARGRKPDGRTVEAVPGLNRVLETAFGLESGETSNMIEADANTYFAVRVAGVEPAKLRPLADVREQVAADWMADQRREAARKQAEEIAGKLRDGTDPAELAKAYPGVTHARTASLPRPPQPTDALPQGAQEQLFTLEPNGVTVSETAEGQVAVRLVEILPADPSAAVTEIGQIRDSLSQSLAGDLISQFVAGLRQRYEVEINRGVLDQMYQPVE